MDIWTQLGRYASFETDRTRLRPFAFSDRLDFFDICQDADNLRFIFPAVLPANRPGWRPVPMPAGWW